MHTFAVGVHMLVLQNDALSICFHVIFKPLCNSVTYQVVVLKSYSNLKRCGKSSRLDCNEKNWKVLDLGLFVGDVISGVGFRPFWLRLPALGPNH